MRISDKSLKEKIALALRRRDDFRRKALACESDDPERAAMFEDFADAADKEADELYDEMRDAEDEEGYRALREYVADVFWAKQR